MKVQEFIEGINDFETCDEYYLKKTLEIKEYVPFAEKRELCAKVLNTCNKIDTSNGLVKVDSISRYIVFTIAILSTYTNLEFSSGQDTEIDSLDEYDMLCRHNLLNPILDAIGAEYTTCNNILNMMMTDVIANNNNIENVLGNTTKKLLEIVDSFVDVLSDKVESLNLDLNQIDIDKYKGLIEQLTQK